MEINRLQRRIQENEAEVRSLTKRIGTCQDAIILHQKRIQQLEEEIGRELTGTSTTQTPEGK
jgi:predicted  nucleic acid-binding Zn-ribbon protein